MEVDPMEDQRQLPCNMPGCGFRLYHNGACGRPQFERRTRQRRM